MKRMHKPRGIIVHTMAFRGKVSPARLLEWHKARRFTTWGYHWYFRYDGTIVPLRSMQYQGAHTKRANDTIGVVFEGHGDLEPWTEAQKTSWRVLGPALAAKFSICTDTYLYCASDVWGHREWKFHGGVRTTKTCPGKMVDMHEVRQMVEL